MVRLIEQERNIIKLADLSERIGIPVQSLIDSLLAGGFEISNKVSEIGLSRKQVSYLANAYVYSIKALHKKYAAKSKYEIPSEDKDARRFFLNFIHNGFAVSSEDVYKRNLNKKLIIEFFYDIIFERKSYFGESGISKILRKVVLSIPREVGDNRKEIISIIPWRANLVYPDEEEHAGLPILRFIFSSAYNPIREALKLLTKSNTLIKWKIYKPLLQT